MYKFVKRLFDFLAAFLALIVLSPIFFITIIGIEISDPGPIFYKAKRIGYKGKEFKMYKFRSMRVPKTDLEKSESSFKADTNRIFPFGALIRKLKIDELPQLVNIVNGTMSIVGPRPASIDQVKVMREGKYVIANSVRPGLTGPAALYDYIYGDTIENPDDYEKLVLPTRRELEAYYPTHMSFALDFKMIWWTALSVISTAIKVRPQKILNKLKEFAFEDSHERSEV